MKLDDLKVGWKAEVEQTHESRDLSGVIHSLEKETSKMDKAVKRRDFLEIGIAICLIPVWAWKLFCSASVIQSVGLLGAIVACIYIPYKLLKAKQVDAAIEDSVLAHLVVEKSKLENQKKLLESIAVWYISPFLMAIILITAGANIDEMGIPQISEQLVIYYGFCALLVVGIYLLNKRAVKKQITPLIDKVNQQVKELTELNQASE